MMKLLDVIDQFIGDATEGHIYAHCRDVNGRDRHTTRDCPAGTLTIVYGDVVYTRTGERDGDFWVFQQDARVWHAGGPLDH